MTDYSLNWTVTEIEEKKAQRARMLNQAHKLAAAGRAMVAGRMRYEDQMHFDALHEEADNLQRKIEAAERRLKASAPEPVRASPTVPTVPGAQPADAGLRPTLMFRGFAVEIPAGSDLDRRRSGEYRDRFASYLGGNVGIEAGRQTDIAEKGGYLAPPEFLMQVVRKLDGTCWVRSLANVLPPTAAVELQLPRRSATATPFAWGNELDTPTPDTGLTTGGSVLHPRRMIGELQVSASFLAQQQVNAEPFVRDEIARNGAKTEEDAFLNGDGIQKPVGLFVPNAQGGVGTDRDVTSTVDQAGLTAAKFNLREPHLRSPSLRWICHKNFIKAIAGLKSTTNEPLYLVSLRAGEPDQLVGTPVAMSEYAPAGTGANGTYASGDYGALIGDLAMYDIVDGLGMSVQVDVSLERRRGLVVFIIRRKVDGCPADPEAFSRLKVA